MIFPVAWPPMLFSHASLTSRSEDLESTTVLSLPSFTSPTRNSMSALLGHRSSGTSRFLANVTLCRVAVSTAEKLAVMSTTFPEALSSGSNAGQQTPTVQWTTPSYRRPDGLLMAAP